MPIKINNILKTTSFDNFKKLEEKGFFEEANIDLKTNKYKSFFNTHPSQYKKTLISSDIKKEVENKIITDIKLLNDKERVKEIAEMLSGDKSNKSANELANELLN